MAVHRVTKGSSLGGGGVVDAGEHGVLFPSVVDFLTLSAWPDGAVRQPGTVMILWEMGWWKAWIHDRSQCRSAWVSGPTPEALFAAVEKLLESDQGDWRPTTPGKGRR